jgi:predicted NUDIX family NTP pyrophosphohydrolase
VRRSAGLLVYRSRHGAGAEADGTVGTDIEVLIAHPGGPFYARRDEGVWSLPKGEYGEGEDPLAAARREFAEETGHDAPDGRCLDLGEVRQSNKAVRAFAYEGDLDPAAVDSNECEIEWPAGSGRLIRIPEIDRVEWVTPEVARGKLVRAQIELVDRLVAALAASR